MSHFTSYIEVLTKSSNQTTVELSDDSESEYVESDNDIKKSKVLSDSEDELDV